MSTVQVFEWSDAAISHSVQADYDFVQEAFKNGLDWLQSKGVIVERHDLRKDKSVLDANPTVKSAFEAQGPGCLPMVMVEDTIISVGGYPARMELIDAVGMSGGIDPKLLGELAVEAASLGAAIAANAFETFQNN